MESPYGGERTCGDIKLREKDNPITSERRACIGPYIYLSRLIGKPRSEDPHRYRSPTPITITTCSDRHFYAPRSFRSPFHEPEMAGYIFVENEMRKNSSVLQEQIPPSQKVSSREMMMKIDVSRFRCDKQDNTNFSRLIFVIPPWRWKRCKLQIE